MNGVSTTIPAQLQKLYTQIDHCARCRAEGNPLRHVLGGGQFRNPRFFFLFINPTHKNRSSHADYEGRRRYPFIGVRHLYKGLAEADFVDSNIIARMYARGWQTRDEHRIENSLRKREVYISNFVKCTRPNPTNPTRRIMKDHLPLLAEELNVVNPRYIVTFGLLPLGVLTGNSYRLRDILNDLKKKRYSPVLSLPLNGKRYEILPCYYPLGHGNPPKAREILKHIRAQY